MWKTSARIASFQNFSVRGKNYCNQNRLCNGKLYKSLNQTCVRSQRRPFSNGGGTRKEGPGAGKVFLGTTVIATGVVIGGIYYANVDPKFRQTIEDRVPYSSALFNAVLGKSEQKPKTVPKKASSPKRKGSENNILPITDKSLTNNADDGEPKFEKPEIQPPEVKIVSPEASDAPVTVSSVDQISVSAVDLDISKAVEKGISDAKKEDKSVSQDTTEPSKDELIKEENKCSECENEKVSKKDAVQDVGETKVQEAKKEEAQLETPPEATAEIALNIAMAIVSEVGQRAIELHEQAVTAVQSYRDSVKEALEGFEKDGGSKEDWEILSKLSETKTQAIDEAEQIGATLTELVEKLQTNITEAKEKGLTTSAEIASETVAKMTYALQQVKTRLSESQVEGNVLKKFQEFIKEGKENLAKELAAIRPGFEIDTLQEKEDGALLAYAEKRIRLLEDTLRQRERYEGKLLEEALQKQEDEHKKLSAMQLKHELEKLRTELNTIMMQKEEEGAKRHEDDLRTQLRRQAAVFNDHLNDVLKVQETELNTKHDGELREKLLLAKQESELNLRGALARLNGIVSAIRNNADIEKYNVEAQELWLATQSLLTVIIGFGDGRDRPCPIRSEVKSIRRVSNGNEVVGKVLDSLSEDIQQRGVYTEEALRRRFPKVKQICRQVAMVGEDGGGVWSYLMSYVQSLFMFETTIVSAPTSIDPEELDTYKVLSLATYALEKGDTEQAVRYMNQLRGEPRRVAKDWIREARLFLEARQAARFLTSYASAYNIGVEQQKQT